MEYYKNFELKNYNSFKLESYAKEIYFPENSKELEMTLTLLKNKKFFILAGGTNVLLKPEIKNIICLTKMPKNLEFYDSKVIVDANVSTSYFINKVIENKLLGVEGLIGIPGKLGGAIIMNAGSGKYSISDYLLAVTTMNYNGKLHVYYKKDLQFGRRYSILQAKKEIVIEALFDFKKGIPNPIEIERAKEHRRNLPKEPSAGGIWRNWYALKPYADKLIGLRVGGAVISKSVNLITNTDKATFEDVMNLTYKIRKIVKEPLQMETKIIG